MPDRVSIDSLEALNRELREHEARLKRLIEQWLEHEQLQDVSASTVQQASAASTANPIPLTERELQILCLVARGQTNRQVGAQLGCTPATIRNRLGRIYWKLGVLTRTHAVVRAIELGLCTFGSSEGS